MADRRASQFGREEILSRQPARSDRPAHVSRHHQGAMDLRTGPSAVERGTRALSLRGTILARPSSSRTHDNDRLRVPPASPTRTSGAEKKESTGLRLSRACRPYAKPSSNSSFDHDRSDARTAEDKSAKSSSVNKSAKVVLMPTAEIPPRVTRTLSASIAVTCFTWLRHRRDERLWPPAAPRAGSSVPACNAARLSTMA